MYITRARDKKGCIMGAPWIPSGFHTITPNIVVDNADKAIEFLTSAFGFHESYRLTTSSGKVAHCELQLGDSVVNLGEAMDGFPRATLLAHIYVEDSDAILGAPTRRSSIKS
jgi:PhnB protein